MGPERSADRISFSGYPSRAFIYALGFLLPVSGSINSFMLIWSDILFSSKWFYVRLDCFLAAACRIHLLAQLPQYDPYVLFYLSVNLHPPIFRRKCYSNLNHTSAAHTTPPVTGVLPLCTRLRRVRRNNPPWRSL